MLKGLVKKLLRPTPVPAGYDPAGAGAWLPAVLAGPPRAVMIPARRAGFGIAEARQIIERDVFVVQHHKPVHLPRPVTWREDPLGDRNWRFWFQAFASVSYLLQAFGETRDAALLERAVELVDAWIATSLENGEAPDMTWNDHSTALRALALLYFLETWRANRGAAPDAPGDRFGRRLLAALVEHGRLLARDDFYVPRHNHGLDQARALFALALNLPGVPEAAAWAELAARRVADQVRETILPDGIHFEHTPDYQGHVYMMLAELELFLSRHGRPWPLLSETCARMVRFTTHCLKPWGDWPNVGDTTPGAPTNLARSMNERDATDPHFLYALTGGREGQPPPERDLLAPDSGFAIWRETWSPERTRAARQVIFTAGFNTVTHKHHDDLSFVLHGFGLDLLIDAGKYKYDYDHPMRQFCESGWGHNVVLRDDAETDLRRLHVGRSGITAVFDAPSVSGVEGEHHLYAKTVVRRMLAWVRPEILIVHDRVVGPAATFRQLLQIGPELRATANGASVCCVAEPALATRETSDGGDARQPGERPALRIVALQPAAAGWTLVRGQEEPPRGWVSRKHSAVEPATTASCVQTGAALDWVTLILIEANHDPRRELRASAELTPSPAAADSYALQVVWHLDGRAGHLRYARTAVSATLECGERVSSDIRALPYRRAKSG